MSAAPCLNLHYSNLVISQLAPLPQIALKSFNASLNNLSADIAYISPLLRPRKHMQNSYVQQVYLFV